MPSSVFNAINIVTVAWQTDGAAATRRLRLRPIGSVAATARIGVRSVVVEDAPQAFGIPDDRSAGAREIDEEHLDLLPLGIADHLDGDRLRHLSRREGQG